MSGARPVGDRRGFTLVELLVAVVVAALLGAAVVTAFATVLRTQDETATRLDGTQGARRVATYFVPDVQSAEEIVVDDTASPCGGAPALVTLRSTGPEVASSVSWAVEPGADEARLLRRACEGSGAVSETVVVPTLVEPPPEIHCDPDCADPVALRLVARGDGGAVIDVSATRRVR